MRRETRVRHVTIWLATLGYGIVALGLPLPLGDAVRYRSPAAENSLAGKDRSRPFPCMDKPCGCETAKQCFSNCCCNTPGEVLAWAKANRSDPSLIATLAQRVAALSQDDSCCSANRSPCCVDAGDQTTAAGEPACGTTGGMTDAVMPRVGGGAARSVSLRALRACQGLLMDWFSLGVTLPTLSVEPMLFAAGLVDRIVLVDALSFGTLPEPDGPPPRGT